ncbi:hypothetical protein D3C87_1087520 [compost metagenome]
MPESEMPVSRQAQKLVPGQERDRFSVGHLSDAECVLAISFGVLDPSARFQCGALEPSIYDETLKC